MNHELTVEQMSNIEGFQVGSNLVLEQNALNEQVQLLNADHQNTSAIMKVFEWGEANQ